MEKTLTSRQSDIINIIQKKGRINRRELSRLLNTTYPCAYYHIKNLQQLGIVKSELKEGVSHWVHSILVGFIVME